MNTCRDCLMQGRSGRPRFRRHCDAMDVTAWRTSTGAEVVRRFTVPPHVPNCSNFLWFFHASNLTTNKRLDAETASVPCFLNMHSVLTRAITSATHLFTSLGTFLGTTSISHTSNIYFLIFFATVCMPRKHDICASLVRILYTKHIECCNTPISVIMLRNGFGYSFSGSRG